MSVLKLFVSRSNNLQHGCTSPCSVSNDTKMSPLHDDVFLTSAKSGALKTSVEKLLVNNQQAFKYPMYEVLCSSNSLYLLFCRSLQKILISYILLIEFLKNFLYSFTLLPAMKFMMLLFQNIYITQRLLLNYRDRRQILHR